MNIEMEPGDWFCTILAALGVIALCWYTLMDHLTARVKAKYGYQEKEDSNGDDLE